MLQLGYVANELRRRLGRTLLTALGLAAGVGLVIGIIGVSQGLDEAQDRVLAPLRSIGSDVLVTRVVGASPTATPAATASPTPAAEPGGPDSQGPRGGFFGPGGGEGRGAVLNQQDTAALLEENLSVVTDLSKLGKPGAKFTRDFFLSGTLLSFPEDALKQVAAIDGVASATAGLTLLAQHQTGTVPEIVAEIQIGGERLTTTVRPAPMTEAEREAFRTCLEKSGTFSSGPPGPGEGGGRRNNSAFQKCLPKRLQQFEASVMTPLRTLRQIVSPPSTDIANKSYTAAGIDPSSPRAGLVTTEQLVGGRWLSGSANEVLASAAYANKNSLRAGSKIPINGKTFTVVGLVNPTLTGSTADLYFPLHALQDLAGKKGRITQVLVKASDASKVDAVAAAVGKALPGAQVVTTKSLADQVTGSLKDAKSLASRLGGALGAIVLAAAFAIAMLLTLSSIAKRVREIGTLRAIGWSKGRVVRQVLGETAGIGLLGGVLGIAVGYAAAFAVGAFTPPLTATTSGVPGFAGSQLSGLFGQATEAVHQTSTIALHAPVRPATLLLGVGFAVLGGALAGAAGGWRAARLAPAEALRTLG